MCKKVLQFRILQDAFIGFGGNVVRSRVKEGALWFVMSFQELIDALDD